MKKTDLEKLKGSFYIYSNGEYVVLPGTKLYIFKTDGSLVACRNDLRYAGRITFLSENRMLLCSSKAVFHMINLCDGSDIWTAPYTKNELNVANLAVSHDESFVYTYDQWKGTHFISRLDLQTHEVDTYDMHMDSGATRGIICNETGTPCLLKTLSETIDGKRFCQNGVRIHDFYDVSPGNTTSWETKWSFDGHRSSLCFLDGTDTVVTTDLHIYRPSTGSSIDLLENEFSWQRPERFPSDCWLDITNRYLCLKYQTANVIIDIHARKVVAQYAAEYKRGCLVGNEYWICVGDRILRKPFPAFEDAPPVKAVINSDWYYSKRPELW